MLFICFLVQECEYCVYCEFVLEERQICNRDKMINIIVINNDVMVVMFNLFVVGWLCSFEVLKIQVISEIQWIDIVQSFLKVCIVLISDRIVIINSVGVSKGMVICVN